MRLASRPVSSAAVRFAPCVRPLARALALPLALPIAALSGIIPFTHHLRFGPLGAVATIGDPATLDLVLDVLQALGIGLLLGVAKLAVMAAPYLSLTKAYGQPSDAQPTRQVILEDARVGAEALLGAEGQGFRFAMAGLDGGRLNIAACSLGGAEAALDIALRYTQERRAFGKAISDFQNTQFKLADMRIELEAARALLWRACAKLDAGEADATMYCAMAKRFVTDTASRVADDALQLLGGYGYLAEYGVEKIVRDLRVHRILEGTNEIMRMIVARKMLGG